jgi:hypothetical protein
MRHPVPLLLMLASTLVFGYQRSPLPEAARPTEGIAVCKPESLPEEVRGHLKREFASWKIQEPETLSQHARERWESEKPVKCPGIAIGQFEKDKTISYGVLLVSQGRPDASYKLLVFSPKGASYETHVLDQSDDGGASNLFIRGVEIKKFFGGSSKRKFRVETREGILSVDSGENEYEADIYFWSGDSYQHEPVDY